MPVVTMSRSSLDKALASRPEIRSGEDFDLRQLTSQIVEVKPKTLLGQLFFSVLLSA